MAEDRPDCYSLYVVTGCGGEPTLHTIVNPASLPWDEVTRVQHYRLGTGTMTQPVSTHSDTDQDRRGHDNG